MELVGVLKVALLFMYPSFLWCGHIKLILRGRALIAEQTRQLEMGNGVMWRLRGNGLKIDSFLEQAKVQKIFTV